MGQRKDHLLSAVLGCPFHLGLGHQHTWPLPLESLSISVWTRTTVLAFSGPPAFRGYTVSQLPLSHEPDSVYVLCPPDHPPLSALIPTHTCTCCFSFYYYCSWKSQSQEPQPPVQICAFCSCCFRAKGNLRM